ncbi:MAG: type II secretion system F family protein [Myxococcales bacterium]|nr:type II secretion system F family protein [Myxococcales bacterium]
MNQLAVLRAGLVATSFVVLFGVGVLAASAPTRAARRTGMRGMKRQQALARGGLFGAIEPLVRWLGLRLTRFVSPQLQASIDRQVAMAGDFLGLCAEEMLALSVLCGVVGAAAGAAANAIVHLGPMLAVAVAAFGMVSPFMTLSSAAADRMKAVTRRLPAAIDLLALCMGAGLDFPGALRQVVERSGTPDDPVIEELSLVLVGLSLGRTRQQALEDFALRAPVPMVRELVASVVQAELRGNPLADVLQIQAEVSRQKRTVLGEEAASSAAVKMIGPLVLLFLAILVLIVGPMVLALKAQGI